MQFPKVVEDDIKLSNHLFEDAYGRQDAAWICERLEARGDVHSIAKDVVTLDDDIAEINAGAILDAAFLRKAGFRLRDRALNAHCAVECINHTGKLHQQGITGRLDDAASTFSQNGINLLLTMSLLARDRSSFVGFHMPRIADHVDGQNGCQPAFDSVRGRTGCFSRAHA
jgi:hypothetical protein